MEEKEAIQTRKDADYLEEIKRRASERDNTARQLRKRQYALENASYLFNIVSVLTAAYFVISWASKYAAVWQIAFSVVLIAILALFELGKRYSISEASEGVYVYALPVAFLCGVSIFASYQGGERFTVEMAAPPAPVHNSQIDSLNMRIAAVDADIERWEQQTWAGKIVRDARQGINRLEDVKADLIKQRASLENRDLKNNDNTQAEHKAEVTQFGNIFGGVAGSMDLLLIACLWLAKRDEKEARILAGILEPAAVKTKVPPHLKAVSEGADTPSRMAKEIERLKKENENLRARADTPAHTHTRTRTHAHTRASARTHAQTRTPDEKKDKAVRKEMECKKCNKKYHYPGGGSSKKFCSKDCRESYVNSK